MWHRLICILLLFATGTTARAAPPLAVSTSATRPQLLHPGQQFAITAVVFSTAEETATIQLQVPPWLDVTQHAPVTSAPDQPALVVYQARVKDGTPLSARGVVTFQASTGPHVARAAFVVSLCCARAPEAFGPRVWMPMVRR